MLTIVARQNETPQPGYTPWLRALDASTEMLALGDQLARTHFKHMGWGHLATPLRGHLARSFHKVAAIAVRLCSDDDTRCAESAAILYARAKHEQLQRDLASPEATPEERDRLIGRFMQTGIAIYLHTLEHGVSGPQHRESARVLAEGLEKFDSEESAS